MRKLIFGCGYLGCRVAQRWLKDGHSVDAVTRSPARAEQLRQAGLRPLLSDVVSATNLPRLGDYDSVLYAIGFDRRASHSMREVYVQGLENVLNASDRRPQRLLYISSTGVYGETSGQWIDERSECKPLREGGQICLDAERALLAHSCGARSIILRMAGLYGPGRLPRQHELLAATPIAAPREGTLNLIYIDDAVDVVLAAEARAPQPSLYVVSDGQPAEREDYFRALAALLGAPPPQFVAADPSSPAAQRARSDKRVSNTKMLRELHVTLRYPSFREGLAAALAAEQHGSFGSAK